MVRLILATHGTFGTALLKAAEGLLGPQEEAFSLELLPGQGAEDLEDAMGARMQAPPAGGQLVLVDLVGGTPFNVGTRLATGQDCDVLAGLSLPMLVDALSLRGGGDYKQLATHLQAKAAGYVVRASDLLREREG